MTKRDAIEIIKSYEETFSRQELLKQGISDALIRTLVLSGDIQRVE